MAMLVSPGFAYSHSNEKTLECGLDAQPFPLSDFGGLSGDSRLEDQECEHLGWNLGLEMCVPVPTS